MDGQQGDGQGSGQVTPRASLARGVPWWRSPRFGVGCVLVAASVALGSWVVDRAGDGSGLWVAAVDLAPGDRLRPEDLRQVEVAWDGGGEVYLPAPQVPPDGVVVSFVGAGELVPRTAVGQARDVDGRPVTVPVPAGTVLEPGVSVDVWSLRSDGAPVLLAEAATVLTVEEGAGLFGSGSDAVARVLVAPDAVASVLAAQADGAGTTLVERPGG